MAQEPNVIEFYEGAVQNMLPILGGIRENQLTASTPCTEWNVQNLVIHNIKVTGFAQGIIRGNNAVDAMDVRGRYLQREQWMRSLPAPMEYWTLSRIQRILARLSKPLSARYPSPTSSCSRPLTS